MVTSNLGCSVTGIIITSFVATTNSCSTEIIEGFPKSPLTSIGTSDMQKDYQNNIFAYVIEIESNEIAKTIDFCASIVFDGGNTYQMKALTF